MSVNFEQYHFTVKAMSGESLLLAGSGVSRISASATFGLGAKSPGYFSECFLSKLVRPYSRMASITMTVWGPLITESDLDLSVESVMIQAAHIAPPDELRPPWYSNSVNEQSCHRNHAVGDIIIVNETCSISVVNVIDLRHLGRGIAIQLMLDVRQHQFLHLQLYVLQKSDSQDLIGDIGNQSVLIDAASSVLSGLASLYDEYSS